MAFLIYKKYGNAETIRYEKLKPLKLGGRDGLIAKHVKTLDRRRRRGAGNSAPPRCSKLAGFAGAVDELAVLFDVTGKDATSVCLYELVKIHGSCRDTSTQLALDLAVVVDEEIGDDAAAYAKSFEIPVPEKPRLARRNAVAFRRPRRRRLEMGANPAATRRDDGAGAASRPRHRRTVRQLQLRPARSDEQIIFHVR